MIEKLNELKKIINKNVSDNQKHFHINKMISTKKRIISLIDEILNLNPKSDKLKIQELLVNIEGAIHIFNDDADSKEFQIIDEIFEKINPIWIIIHNASKKIKNKQNIADKEWLNIAKFSLESMIKGDIDIEFISNHISDLIFLNDLKVNKKIKNLYSNISCLNNPFSSKITQIQDKNIENTIIQLLEETNKLLKIL